MCDILMGPAHQPFFWAVGLFIYAVIVALVATACGLSVGAIGYLVFRKSRTRVARMGLPSLMAVSTFSVVFLVIYSTVCCWAFGVFATPDERLLTPSQPVSEEDMVGTWTLDARSLERMEEEGGYKISTHTLTFRDDGTFELVNMPDWCGFGATPTGGFYSSSGTWRITESSGEWGIFVHFASLPDYEEGLYTVFDIGGREPPYYIWMYAGDPDAGIVMVFEKQ
jgi:hypothetical protein